MVRAILVQGKKGMDWGLVPPEKDLNFYFLEREKTEKIYTLHG